MSVSIFDDWERKPSHTEVVVAKLIGMGLELDTPKEYSTLYRVQRKTTGCEARLALTELSRFGSGCEDITLSYQGWTYHGIDLLASVKDLASKPIELVGHRFQDPFLWVCLASRGEAQ